VLFVCIVLLEVAFRETSIWVLFTYIVILMVVWRDLLCVLYVYIERLKVDFEETCVGCCMCTS